METEKHLEGDMGRASYRLEIPLRLPGLNEYTQDCRSGYLAGASTKKKAEKDLAIYIAKMPVFEAPIKIHFTWIEENARRDPDNICFAKKFILDSMVRNGKLQNDNRKWVKAFTDDFETGETAKVILEIEGVEDGI